MARRGSISDYVGTLIEVDAPEDADIDTRHTYLEKFLEKAPIASKKDAKAFLKHHFPGISDGAHRGHLRRRFEDGGAPWEEGTTCPECGKVADDNEQAQELFGFRSVGGKIIAQSWCRECRNTQKREKNTKKEQAS